MPLKKSNSKREHQFNNVIEHEKMTNESFLMNNVNQLETHESFDDLTHSYRNQKASNDKFLSAIPQ